MTALLSFKQNQLTMLYCITSKKQRILNTNAVEASNNRTEQKIWKQPVKISIKNWVDMYSFRFIINC